MNHFVSLTKENINEKGRKKESKVYLRRGGIKFETLPLRATFSISRHYTPNRPCQIFIYPLKISVGTLQLGEKNLFLSLGLTSFL